MKLTPETEGRLLVDFAGCLERQPFWVGDTKTCERNGVPAVGEKAQQQREFQKGSGTIPVDAASFFVRFLPAV